MLGKQSSYASFREDNKKKKPVHVQDRHNFTALSG